MCADITVTQPYVICLFIVRLGQGLVDYNVCVRCGHAVVLVSRSNRKKNNNNNKRNDPPQHFMANSVKRSNRKYKNTYGQHNRTYIILQLFTNRSQHENIIL